MRWTLALIALAVSMFIATFFVRAYAQDEESPIVSCDNSDRPDTATRLHNCKCERTTAECDTDREKVTMSNKCGKYCDEKACACENHQCS